MVKIRLILVLALLLLLNTLRPFSAQCDVFEYKHIKGARYRILSVVDEAVFLNGVLSHRAEILNRIAVEVTDVKDGRGVHKAVFQTSERLVYDSAARSQTGSGFFWTREYDSVFERDKLGYLTIDPKYYMPVVRNVPVLPNKDIKITETWRAEGYEIHDFRDAFGIEEPYRIPFTANYTYVGQREWKGKNYPAFSVSYKIASRPQAAQGRIYPVRIMGDFDQIVYWDHSLGQEVAYEESFRMTFDMSDKRKIEFRGTAQAEFVEAETMNKEQFAAEIVKEIDRLKIPDVSVNVVDGGISLTLENIQFQPDSNRMLPGEHEKLNRIAAILKNYPNRDIVISGHTALARGTREDHLLLSQDRAKAVADYLLENKVRTADRMVIRGYGADMPIADNSTEAGMRKNRRVEITILEN
jgi:outer membrane protein OmpA-like peptidoglycan-associated protein